MCGKQAFEEAVDLS